MRRHALVISLAVSMVLPFVMAAAPTAPAAVGDGPPTVHASLVQEVAAADADARFEVIVTTWDRAGLAAVEVVGAEAHALRTVPIAFAQVTGAELAALAEDRRVRSLWPDEQHDLLLDEGTTMVGADRVASDLGIDGSGVIVGVIDTGIDTTHPDLDDGKVLGNFEIVDSPFDGTDQLVHSPDTDDHGHGTHVASTIAGLDDDGGNVMDGVAPGADLYGYSINVGASVLTSHALIAFDDLLLRRQAGEPIVAASNSWGGADGTYSPDDPLAVSTRALFEGGIVPVFAAGNSGPGLETTSNQCTIPWTFCVGAITKGRTLAGFSSRGRTPDATTEERPDGVSRAIQAGNHDVALGQALEVGVYRPNVSAPGVDIEAACARLAGCPGGYQLMSGTSMATPHVSGVIALVQSARLAATAALSDARTATTLVEGTANRLPGYELWETGTGEVDALEATRIASQAVADEELAIPVANVGATNVAGGETSSETFAGPVLPNGWQTGEGTYVAPFEVDAGAVGYTALLTWPNPTDNIYLNLYAPGLEPGVDPPTAQSAGLLDGNAPYTRGYRDLDVHFPEPGTWHLEVLGRVNAPTEVQVDITQRLLGRPGIAITELTDERVAGTTDATGLASPTTTGLTRPAVPGSAEPVPFEGEPAVNYLHSTGGAADGAADVFLNGTPLASFDGQEPATPVSKVSEVTMVANTEYAGNPLTAYWRGDVPGAIAGDVLLDAYLSTPTGAAFTTNLTATLFSTADEVQGTKAGDPSVTVLARTTVEAEIGTAPTLVNITIPGVVTGDLSGGDVVIQLSSTYIDTGHVQVWHDSTVHPSTLTIPVLAADAAIDVVAAPTALTATDGTGGGATLAWSEVAGVSTYAVESAADPTGPWTEVFRGDALTYQDAAAPVRTATYYRVRSVTETTASPASAIAYATPVDDAATVEVQFGTGPWEQATLSEDGTWEFAHVAGSEETCTTPGKGRQRPDRGNGKGKGAPETCETTVVYAPLPDGDLQARANRWFTTSVPATPAG